MLRRRTSSTTRRVINNRNFHRCSHSKLRAYSTALAAPITTLTRPRTSSRDSRPLCPTSHQIIHIRGAKRQATVSIDDIAQGPLASEVTIIDNQDDEPGYPPLLQQVRNNMLKFSHCVLLTRVGGFYEVRLTSQVGCHSKYRPVVF